MKAIMKAKVIETGEVIDVQCLYSVRYSRLDCNGKIMEEYYEDELEILPNPNRPKMVSLDKAVEWLEDNIDDKYIHFTLDGCRDPEILRCKISEDFKKEMEE